MQLAHETRTLLSIDDETQVQVVGGLRHQVYALFLEHLERGSEARQDRANLAADETHGAAIRNHADMAQLTELADDGFLDVGRQHAVARVNRHRHVGLGGRHEIDRDAVVAENSEGLRKEADFMPHADGCHRNERELVANTDSLDLRLDFFGHLRNDGTGDGRCRRAANEKRDAVVAYGRNATWVQHGTAGRSQLLGFVVMQRREQACRWHDPGVCRKHARNIGPDLEAPCLHTRREIGGRRIGTAAPEQNGFACSIARDKSLREHDLAGCLERAPESRVRRIFAGCGKIGVSRVAVIARAALQEVAGIHPFDRQSEFAQILRAEPGRHQFSEGHHPHPHPHADFAHQAHARYQLAKFMK